MTDTRVLLGVSWNDSTPYLRLRDDDETVSQLIPAAGVELNYQLESSARRLCLGHVPFRSDRGAYHDCRRVPEAGKRRCERCSIVEATFASNLHHAHTKGTAELDPSVRDHLQQPNRLYLAAFRDGSVKVGTTTLPRTQKRLEEQGAWMARQVAETTNGIAVRSLEDMVTEVWSLPQAVSGSRKVKGLISPRPDAELEATLNESAQRVFELMERTPDERVTPLFGDDGLGVQWRHPIADHAATLHALAYPLSLTAGHHDLEVVTAVGRALFVRRRGPGGLGDDVFAIDPAPLFGIELDIGDYGSDEIAIQDALF